jgi:hypothetical protein
MSRVVDVDVDDDDDDRSRSKVIPVNRSWRPIGL